MKDFPLISAVVIHYNNGEYLYETIDSILRQNYPNIELLITDDCSNEGFDVDRVIQYINDNRRDNLKRTIININPKSVGDVKNIEIIRAKEHGEFELLIDGDSVWHDSDVFSAFAERFEELGSDAEWLSSQIEICDETLENVKELFVKPEVIDMITNGSYWDLLSFHANRAALPYFGAAFRRTIFEKIGALSDDYGFSGRYVSQIRAMRLGIPVYYLDRVTVRYRDGRTLGGILEKKDNLPVDNVKEYVKIYENEILPFKKYFSSETMNKSREQYVWSLNLLKNPYSPYPAKSLKQNPLKKEENLYNKFIKSIETFRTSFQVGKIKKDFITLIILLASLTFLRFGELMGKTQDSLITYVRYGIWVTIVILGIRILFFALAYLKNRANTQKR